MEEKKSRFQPNSHPCHKLSVPASNLYWCRHCMKIFDDPIERWKHSRTCKSINSKKALKCEESDIRNVFFGNNVLVPQTKPPDKRTPGNSLLPGTPGPRPFHAKALLGKMPVYANASLETKLIHDAAPPGTKPVHVNTPSVKMSVNAKASHGSKPIHVNTPPVKMSVNGNASPGSKPIHSKAPSGKQPINADIPLVKKYFSSSPGNNPTEKLSCYICQTKFSSFSDMRHHVKYPCSKAAWKGGEKFSDNLFDDIPRISENGVGHDGTKNSSNKTTLINGHTLKVTDNVDFNVVGCELAKHIPNKRTLNGHMLKENDSISKEADFNCEIEQFASKRARCVEKCDDSLSNGIQIQGKTVYELSNKKQFPDKSTCVSANGISVTSPDGQGCPKHMPCMTFVNAVDESESGSMPCSKDEQTNLENTISVAAMPEASAAATKDLHTTNDRAINNISKISNKNLFNTKKSLVVCINPFDVERALNKMKNETIASVSKDKWRVVSVNQAKIIVSRDQKSDDRPSIVIKGEEKSNENSTQQSKSNKPCKPITSDETDTKSRSITVNQSDECSEKDQTSVHSSDVACPTDDASRLQNNINPSGVQSITSSDKKKGKENRPERKRKCAVCSKFFNSAEALKRHHKHPCSQLRYTRNLAQRKLRKRTTATTVHPVKKKPPVKKTSRGNSFFNLEKLCKNLVLTKDGKRLLKEKEKCLLELISRTTEKHKIIPKIKSDFCCDDDQQSFLFGLDLIHSNKLPTDYHPPNKDNEIEELGKILEKYSCLKIPLPVNTNSCMSLKVSTSKKNNKDCFPSPPILEKVDTLKHHWIAMECDDVVEDAPPELELIPGVELSGSPSCYSNDNFWQDFGVRPELSPVKNEYSSIHKQDDTPRKPKYSIVSPLKHRTPQHNSPKDLSNRHFTDFLSCGMNGVAADGQTMQLPVYSCISAVNANKTIDQNMKTVSVNKNNSSQNIIMEGMETDQRETTVDSSHRSRAMSPTKSNKVTKLISQELLKPKTFHSWRKSLSQKFSELQQEKEVNKKCELVHSPVRTIAKKKERSNKGILKNRAFRKIIRNVHQIWPSHAIRMYENGARCRCDILDTKRLEDESSIVRDILVGDNNCGGCDSKLDVECDSSKSMNVNKKVNSGNKLKSSASVFCADEPDRENGGDMCSCKDSDLVFLVGAGTPGSQSEFKDDDSLTCNIDEKLQCDWAYSQVLDTRKKTKYIVQSKSKSHHFDCLVVDNVPVPPADFICLGPRSADDIADPELCNSVCSSEPLAANSRCMPHDRPSFNVLSETDSNEQLMDLGSEIVLARAFDNNSETHLYTIGDPVEIDESFEHNDFEDLYEILMSNKDSSNQCPGYYSALNVDGENIVRDSEFCLSEENTDDNFVDTAIILRNEHGEYLNMIDVTSVETGNDSKSEKCSTMLNEITNCDDPNYIPLDGTNTADIVTEIDIDVNSHVIAELSKSDLDRLLDVSTVYHFRVDVPDSVEISSEMANDLAQNILQEP